MRIIIIANERLYSWKKKFKVRVNKFLIRKSQFAISFLLKKNK